VNGILVHGTFLSPTCLTMSEGTSQISDCIPRDSDYLLPNLRIFANGIMKRKLQPSICISPYLLELEGTTLKEFPILEVFLCAGFFSCCCAPATKPTDYGLCPNLCALGSKTLTIPGPLASPCFFHPKGEKKPSLPPKDGKAFRKFF